MSSSYLITENAICLLPLIKSKQYYRIITSEFIHAGIAHWVMNMLTLLNVGKSVELDFGSIPFVFITLVLIILSGGIYLGLCAFMAYSVPEAVFGGAKMLEFCSVGYSNVLFGYLLIYIWSKGRENETFPVFGLFNMDKKYLPWVLMLLMQFLVPKASFIGHISGLIGGVMMKYGMTAWILPKFEWISAFEAKLSCLHNADISQNQQSWFISAKECFREEFGFECDCIFRCLNNTKKCIIFVASFICPCLPRNRSRFDQIIDEVEIRNMERSIVA